MRKRKTFYSVLHNFLSTYVSRYSEHDGFWLFGMVVVELTELHIDLLNPTIEPSFSAPIATAIRLAAKRFQEQLEKARVNRPRVIRAELVLTKNTEARRGEFCGRQTVYGIRLVATLLSDREKSFSAEEVVYAAPHDSARERRSGCADR